MIFGGTGNDTLQLIPDFVPGSQYTQSDYFDGGTGENRVVFVGADASNSTPSVGIPDALAIRYNSTLHRYELAQLVVANIGTAASPAYAFLTNSGQLEEKLSYYQAVNVQQTIIDARGGANIVHADPGFVFPGTTQSWGFNPGDCARVRPSITCISSEATAS